MSIELSARPIWVVQTVVGKLVVTCLDPSADVGVSVEESRPIVVAENCIVTFFPSARLPQNSFLGNCSFRGVMSKILTYIRPFREPSAEQPYRKNQQVVIKTSRLEAIHIPKQSFMFMRVQSILLRNPVFPSMNALFD